MLAYVQVGLLYDEESLQSILDMTFDWTKEEREMLRRKVSVVVLQTTAGWRKAPALAQRVCTQGVASLRSI